MEVEPAKVVLLGPVTQELGDETGGNKDEEWQAKLSSLQEQHKNESFQQQQEHLEQLRHLQTQLLRQLSSDMTLEGRMSSQDLWQSEKEQNSQERRRDTVEKQLPVSISGSPEKPSKKESQTISSPTQSLNYDQSLLPIPHTDPTRTHSPIMSPHNPHSSPSNQGPVQNTAIYKILGPKSIWETGSSTQSSQIITRSWAQTGTPQSTNRGDTQSRGSLMAKHAKHVEDLKTYYEAELLALRRQLELFRPGSLGGSPLRGSIPSSPAQRQLVFSDTLSPAKESINESQLWMLQSENKRLQSTCSGLQEQLDESEREKHVLEGQLKRLQWHLSEWQERCETSERLTSVLQERLDTTRTQLHDQERLNGQLNSDLKLTTEELVFWKDQKLQDVEKLDQLFREFEVLQSENQMLQREGSELRTQQEESGRETVLLRSSLDKYQLLEAQYKSTIRKLEDEVRHLEHINNRQQSQMTHYETGWSKDSGSSQHTPRSSQPTKHHHEQHTSPHTANTLKSPERRENRKQGQIATPQSVPLTRKKWLETSVPGLLFGGQADTEEKIVSSTSQLANQTSPDSKPVRHSPRRHTHVQGNTEGTKERAPTRFSEGNLEDALRAVRDGSVVTSGEGKRKPKRNEQSLEDRVREQLELVGEAEQRLGELQTEKERLEGALQRTPRVGARVTREAKQNKLKLEERLEQVVKEIGSVRMVLRKHHALKR